MLIEIYVKALLVGEEPASVLKFLEPKAGFTDANPLGRYGIRWGRNALRTGYNTL